MHPYNTASGSNGTPRTHGTYSNASSPLRVALSSPIDISSSARSVRTPLRDRLLTSGSGVLAAEGGSSYIFASSSSSSTSLNQNLDLGSNFHNTNLRFDFSPSSIQPSVASSVPRRSPAFSSSSSSSSPTSSFAATTATDADSSSPLIQLSTGLQPAHYGGINER